MISARQELDLRPQMERLDRLVLRSAGLDPAALTFEFRPLWQMDAAAKASIALQKAQATQIYAGLNLWPTETTARLVRSQLAEDGTYPGAEGVFAEAARPQGAQGVAAAQATTDFDPNQARDPDGRWANGGARAGGAPSSLGGEFPSAFDPRTPLPQTRSPAASGGLSSLLQFLDPIGSASAQEIDPEEENRGLGEDPLDPTAEIRIERYANARTALKEMDPHNAELETLSAPGYVPSENDIARLEAAAKTALAAKADLGPPSNGLPVLPGTWQLGGLVDPELHLRASPSGLSLTVKGSSTTGVGNSYASQVRAVLAGLPGPRSTDLGSANPDGLYQAKVGNALTAIEAKYVEKWSESIYNPELRRAFPHNEVEDTVRQAVAYDNSYPGGVEWITNSMEFVRAYAPRFRAAGAKNFYFTIIPAVREVSR